MATAILGVGIILGITLGRIGKRAGYYAEADEEATKNTAGCLAYLLCVAFLFDFVVCLILSTWGR